MINDKEKSVVYTVPEHNGIVGSEILFDYKTVCEIENMSFSIRHDLE